MIPFDANPLQSNSLESKKTHPSPKKKSHAMGTAASFSLSQRVMARYRGRGDFFEGKIVKVHEGDKYDIEYDDGDTDLSLSAGFIIPLPPSKKRGRGRPRKNPSAPGGPAPKVQKKRGKNQDKPSSSQPKPGRLLRQLSARTAMFPFTEVFCLGIGNSVIRYEGPTPSPGLSSLPDETKIEVLGQFAAMCIHEERGSLGIRIYGKRYGFCRTQTLFVNCVDPQPSFIPFPKTHQDQHGSKLYH